MATEKKNERKHELKDIQLFEEKGQYYLKLKYIIEDEYSVKELEIPKVMLPFTDAYPYIEKSVDYNGRITLLPRTTCRLMVTNTSLPMCAGETTESCGCEVFFTEKIIKEKHKEMTLAEIERKLGYKIKIVAEE